jgi:hypothetical protein
MVITYIFIYPPTQHLRFSLHMCSSRFLPHTVGGPSPVHGNPTLVKWGAAHAPNLNHSAHQIIVEEAKYAIPVAAKLERLVGDGVVKCCKAMING